MQVCITIDMEQDCPPFRTTYHGVENGTPQLLALFKDEQIPATFFTTIPPLCTSFPSSVANVIPMIMSRAAMLKMVGSPYDRPAQQAFALSARGCRASLVGR